MPMILVLETRCLTSTGFVPEKYWCVKNCLDISGLTNGLDILNGDKCFQTNIFPNRWQYLPVSLCMSPKSVNTSANSDTATAPSRTSSLQMNCYSLSTLVRTLRRHQKT